jgi:hypothetical protein
MQHKTIAEIIGEAARLLPPPWQPMQVARQFISEHALSDGVLKLRYWRGAWWSWRGACWRESEYRAVDALLYAYTEEAVYSDAKGMPVPWAPNRRKIGDLREALAAWSRTGRG